MSDPRPPEDGSADLAELNLKEFREDLLAVTCRQALTKLTIFQRGQRLNSTVYNPNRLPSIKPPPPNVSTGAPSHRRPSMGAAKLRQSYQGISGAPVAVDGMGSMPSEQVMNEIKLEKDLDMLKDIFEMAEKELGGYGRRQKARDAEGGDLTEEQKPEQQKEPSPESPRANEKLLAFIEAQGRERNKVDRLEQELQTNRDTLKALKVQMETERKAAEQRMAEQDERFATLRHNLKNVTRVNNLELALVERWEENRCVQADIVCSNQERQLQGEIDRLKQRLEGEQRSICEVQNFNERQFEELRARIASWQQKYASEMAVMQEQITEKEQRIAEVMKLHERHRQTCAEHKEFVRQYQEEKEAQRHLEEQQRLRIESAIRLQAWWRGVMVRKGFGPFRKKSKKGKKGKKK